MYLPVPRAIRYGALAAVVILGLGAAVLVRDRDDATEDKAAPKAAEEVHRPALGNPPTAVDRRVAATPSADPADADALPSAAQSDQVARLIGDARRLAEDGKLDEAKAALDKAEKVVPGMTEIAEARRDVAALGTPQGQRTLQLARARTAIAQDDRAGAEKAIAALERLDPQAPEVAALRQALQHDEQQDAERSRRIAGLLDEMRQAIARKDLAGAARALNEATRLDVRDPSVDAARAELLRAQDALR